MMQRIVLFAFVLLFISFNSTFAQTDNVFWFAAPDICHNHGHSPPARYGDGRPLYIHVNALQNTTITISRPADPTFTPISVFLAQGQSRSFNLEDSLTLNQIECHANTVENHGFLIESSPGEITAFYEMNNQYNRDIFSLKGKNGLGRSFTVTTQNIFSNTTSASYSDAFSGFVVVATEDNTTINVQSAQNFVGHPAGLHTIVLNRGETYNFMATSRTAANHPQGVKVTSDKDIAVTIYDDSMMRTSNSYGNGGCLDTFGDQYIPDDLAGQEYIVLTGLLGSSAINQAGYWRREYIFITAITDNTVVSIDGVAVTTLAARQVYSYQINQASDLTYVSLSKPGYVNHVTGGGYGCEQGGAVLPPIDKCTGSYNVTFSHSGPSGDDYALTMMARNDTVTGSPTKNQVASNFTLTVGGTTYPIPASYFNYTSDSAFIYLRDDSQPADDGPDGVVYQFFYSRIPTGDPPTVARIDNNFFKFHLGVLNGGASNGGKHGFFSDYAASSMSAGIGGAFAPNQDSYCTLDPVRLVASGGFSYYWTCTTDPSYNSRISDRNVADPFFFPDTNALNFYDFTVEVEGECFDTIMPVKVGVAIGPTSDFSLSEVEGCSPFTTTITNSTDLRFAKEMRWVFDPPNIEVNQNTLPGMTFDRTFINNSDSLQVINITLFSALSASGACANQFTRKIRVKPAAYAALAAPDSSGCNEFIVPFENLSTGHLDSTSYKWKFGDGQESYEFEPIYTYPNYTDRDTTYTATLIVTSPLGCIDSSSIDIQVFPRVSAMFSADTNGCSPITFTLDPKNSFNVDSLFWNIDYIGDSTIDSIFVSTSKTPYQFTHRDTTSASPDTVNIFLVGRNDKGCYDTSATRNLRVFPEIVALLDVSDTAVCDSVPIVISNISQGSNMTFTWDFGDNTSQNDDTLQTHTKYYRNQSDSSIQHTITLKAKSNFECENETDTVVTIHPKIKTKFDMLYGLNCSPLDVKFVDGSHRVHTYNWHLEGDSIYTTSSDASFNYLYNNRDINNDTTFYIKLVGYNNEGCSDSTTRSVKVFPPVVASFDPVDTAGCAPMILPIRNYSTGGTLLFSWDYGDGIKNSNPLPSFTKKYNNTSDKDTTFTIKLEATTPVGCSDTMSTTVTVFAEVRADFTMPVYDSCSPFKPRITNTSTDGSIYTAWYKDVIGDSLKSLNWNPDFDFLTNKSTTTDSVTIYLVTYQAADSAHQQCSDTTFKTIAIYPELNADFTLSNPTDCQPLISSITNNSNITSGTVFRWYQNTDYHDQAITPRDLNVPNETSSDVVHTLWMYGRTGFGCRDTASQQFTVYSRVYPEFNASPSTICSGDSVLLDRKGSAGGLTKYTWNFNNEETSNRTDEIFYHTFENLDSTLPVSKFVTLTVANDQGCDSSMTKIVSVSPEVIADFDPDFPEICYPHTTQFINKSSNAATYSWNFGNGTTSSQTAPQLKYKNLSNINDEVFDVKLIAKSTYRCVDSITKQVTIFAKPYSNFSFPVSVDCSPFEAEMVDSSVGANLSYFWDFAGEGSSDEKNPEFTFGNTGAYIVDKPVTFVVTSDKNCKDTLVKKLRVYPEVATKINTNVDKGCSPLLVNFDGITTNTHKQQWYIDGQPFDNIEDPTYNFNNETPNDTVFRIQLVGNSIFECYDTAETIITVYATPITDFIALPPNALTEFVYDTENDQTQVDISNETIFQNNWDYEWDYGDGNFDNQDRGDFTYTYGAYFWGDNSNSNLVPIRLVAWNKLFNQCRDTIYHNIKIKPPAPQVDLLGDVVGCQPFETKFKAITKYVYDDQFEWDFGNGVKSYEKFPVYRYETPGRYTVTLDVKGDGGAAYDSKEISVQPTPIVDFTFSDSIATVSSQTKEDDIIQFYNHTKYGDTWEWYFDKNEFLNGGMPGSYEKEPSHAYENIGIFYAVLIGTSEYECSDTLIHEKPIVVKGEGTIAFPTGFFVDPTKGPADEYNTDQVTPNMYLFYPKNNGVERYRLEVYDRWGTLVFESDDVNRGWNGYIKGVEGIQNVYVWRCHGVYTNGEKFEQSGDVTLLRAPVNVDMNKK